MRTTQKIAIATTSALILGAGMFKHSFDAYDKNNRLESEYLNLRNDIIEEYITSDEYINSAKAEQMALLDSLKAGEIDVREYNSEVIKVVDERKVTNDLSKSESAEAKEYQEVNKKYNDAAMKTLGAGLAGSISGIAMLFGAVLSGEIAGFAIYDKIKRSIKARKEKKAEEARAKEEEAKKWDTAGISAKECEDRAKEEAEESLRAFEEYMEKKEQIESMRNASMGCPVMTLSGNYNKDEATRQKLEAMLEHAELEDHNMSDEDDYTIC